MRYMKFPDMWRLTLNNRDTTAADWKVGVELLNRAKFSPVVKLSNVAAAKLGICSRTKRRSLDRLERWGLIAVRRRVGTGFWIRVLWLSGRQPAGR